MVGHDRIGKSDGAILSQEHCMLAVERTVKMQTIAIQNIIDECMLPNIILRRRQKEKWKLKKAKGQVHSSKERNIEIRNRSLCQSFSGKEYVGGFLACRFRCGQAGSRSALPWPHARWVQSVMYSGTSVLVELERFRHLAAA